MTTSIKTGRTRVRAETVGLFKKKTLLVLQVEFEVEGEHHCPTGVPGRPYKYTTWRDAQPEDITIAENGV